jgi:hypothetical protein
MDSCPETAISLFFILLLPVTLAWAVRAGRAARLLFSELRTFLEVLDAKHDGFDELPHGRVALVGRVVPIDPVVSEESGRRGVYLRCVVDRLVRHTTFNLTGGVWNREGEDAETAPFEITDGKRTVLVDPEGARFEVPLDEPAQFSRNGVLIRYAEAILEEGTEVLVVGEAAEEGGFEPSQTYRGHTLRTVMRAGRDGLLVAHPSGFSLEIAFRIVWRLLVVLGLIGCLALDVYLAPSILRAL